MYAADQLSNNTC